MNEKLPAPFEPNAPPGVMKPARRVRAKVVQLRGAGRQMPVPIDEPHAEWVTALENALGTTSSHFVEVSLKRLMAAAMMPGETVASTNSLSAALALIQGMQPENEAQAALAVNAACLQSASTNVLSRLAGGGGDRRTVMLATAAARLERAFHSALETYYKIKRGNTQVIRVEKLEIQAGAQAIVGNVSRS